MQSREELERQISEAVSQRAAFAARGVSTPVPSTAIDSSVSADSPPIEAAPITASPHLAANDDGDLDDDPPLVPASPLGVIPRVGWGVMGFLIGAVFWHFIGFWGFVSEIVFVGSSVRDERLVEQTGPLCVQLVLDRASGQVLDEACPSDTPFLNEGALAVRGDFAGDRGPKLGPAKPAIRLSDGTR